MGMFRDQPDDKSGKCREELRYTVAAFPDNVFIAEVREGRVTCIYTGRGIADLLGYSVDDIQADLNLWFDIIHPADRERVKNAFSNLFEGLPISEVYRVYRSDGQMYWIRTTAVGGKDEKGQVNRIIGFLSKADIEKSVPEQLVEYKQLLDETPTAVGIRELNGRLIYCNKSYLALYGFDNEDDASKTTFNDLVPPEDLDDFNKDILPLVIREPWSGEMRLRRKDGRIIDAELSTNVIRDFEGKPIALYSLVTDITARKMAEDALRYREKLFRQFIESTPAAVAMFDNEMRYLAVSKRWILDYNLTDRNIVGKTHYEIFPDIPDRWKEIHQQVLRGEPRTCKEDKFERYDGTVIWISWDLQPWHDDSGEIGGMIMFTEVITDQVRAAAALKESEEKYRTLVERSNDGIVVIQDAIIKFVNQKFVESSGYTAEELLEKPFLIFLPQEERVVLQERYTRRMAGEDVPPVYEMSMTRKDGRKLDLEINAGLIHYEGKLADLVLLRDITDRKRAEQALRESQAKYQAIVEAFDGLIYICSPDYKIEFMNRRFIERSGSYPLGEKCYKALHGLDGVCPWCVNDRVIKGEVVKWELLSPRDNRWYYIVNTPIFRPDGKVSKMAMIQDITERKDIEEALKESEERFRNLVTNIPNVVWTIDESENVVFISSKVKEITGFSPEEVYSWSDKGFYDRIHPEDTADVRKAFDRLVKKSIPLDVEYKFLTKDGRWIWLQDRSSYTYVKNGVVYADGSFSDITDRKNFEQRLKASEENYRTLVERLDSVIYRITPDRRPISIYGNLEQMSGYTVREIIDDPTIWASRIHYADQDYVNRTLAEIGKSGTPGSMEMRLIDKSGNTRWLRTHVTPVYNADGSLRFFDGVILEVSDRVKIEQALRDSEERLRTMIEGVDAVLFKMDSDMRLLAIGGKPEDIAGCTGEELMADPRLWMSSIDSDDLEIVARRLSEIVECGKPGSVEFRIHKGREQTGWIRGHFTPKYNDNGEFQYFNGVYIDITERMEAQQREFEHNIRMASLAEISEDFTRSLDTEKIVSVITRKCGEALDALCSIFTIDRNTGKIHHVALFSKDKALAERVDNYLENVGLLSEEAFGFEGIRAANVPDMRAHTSESVVRYAQFTGLGPAIVVPLYAENELIGILGAGRPAGKPQFNEEDLWFLTEVASHASGSLTTAKLYRKQTRIAETFQRSLIPATPVINNLELASIYNPATGEAEVGGDFFDILEFGDSMVGIVVGDVSGKGMDAAIHTAESKYMLRGFASENPDPMHVISHLNQALCDYLSEFTFVTLVYILLDTHSGIMTYINAGHELPLTRRGDEALVLRNTGPMLGILAKADYKIESLQLGKEDILFCYTDGVTDVVRDGERFGFDRLYSVVSIMDYNSPVELLDTVACSIDDFGRGDHPDDQVMLAIRLK